MTRESLSSAEKLRIKVKSWLTNHRAGKPDPQIPPAPEIQPTLEQIHTVV